MSSWWSNTVEMRLVVKLLHLQIFLSKVETLLIIPTCCIVDEKFPTSGNPDSNPHVPLSAKMFLATSQTKENVIKKLLLVFYIINARFCLSSSDKSGRLIFSWYLYLLKAVCCGMFLSGQCEEIYPYDKLPNFPMRDHLQLYGI